MRDEWGKGGAMKKLVSLVVMMSCFGIVLLNVNLNAQRIYNNENCVDNIGTHHYSKVAQMDEELLYNRTHLPRLNHGRHMEDNYNSVNLDNVATNLVDRNSMANDEEIHNIDDCVDALHNHKLQNEYHDVNKCTDVTHEHYAHSGKKYNHGGHKQNQNHIRNQVKNHH